MEKVRERRLMVALLDKRFVVVAGKGGVGRTTVSLILGLCAAWRGRRTLVCLNNAPPRYSELLGGIALVAQPQQVVDRLFVANLDPVSAREEYGLMILRNRALHRLVFASRVVNGFLDAVPGLAEWAMLGKATFHALNTVDGAPEYDLVIFDSPATGHGLDLLSLPDAIASSVPSGRIREEALERVELLADGGRSEVLPVAIAQELPTNETVELVRALRQRSLPVFRLVLNMTAKERARGDPGALDPRAAWAIPARVVLAEEESAKRCRERLDRELGLPMLELPAQTREMDEASVVRLARHFNRLI